MGKRLKLLEKDIELFKKAYDPIKDGVCALNPETMEILYTNPIYEEIFGKKLVGKACYSKFTKHNRICPNCDVLRYIKEERDPRRETESTNQYGKKFWAEITTSLIKNEDDEVKYVVETLRDITKRKALEQGLEENLEKRNKLNKELEYSNHLKDIFIDIMKHDLFNSTTFIENMSKIMNDDETDPEKKEQLEMIANNAKKIEDLIEDAALLATLKDKKSLDLKEINLGDEVEKIIKYYRNEFESKNIKLMYESKDVHIYANPLIVDAIDNIVKNALKYVKGGKVEVGFVDSDTNIELYVEDTGLGIEDEHKEKIFGRFERVSKESVKGSGLGLAIVKRIVEAHNGKVWVEDRVTGNHSEGSKFIIKLPKKQIIEKKS